MEYAGVRRATRVSAPHGNCCSESNRCSAKDADCGTGCQSKPGLCGAGVGSISGSQRRWGAVVWMAGTAL